METLDPPAWKTRPKSQGQDCAQWRFDPQSERVLFRHSKRPDSEVLEFTLAEWRAFIAGAKEGEADL